MKKDLKISNLPADDSVLVLLDVDDSVLCFETTAGDLVRTGFGGLDFVLESDEDQPTILASREQFEKLKVVFGKTSTKREIWKKLGRRVLPDDKRASQQIPLRVSAARKAHYVEVAKANHMSLSAWMFWVCDKASGYREQ